MKKLIDANVILRYLLNDNKEMSEAAKKVISEGAFTIPEVLAEVVYVLSGVYKIERKEIAECLILALGEIEVNDADVMRRALIVFADKNLDFVDCILIARYQVLGETVFSFDKKLNKNLIMSN